MGKSEPRGEFADMIEPISKILSLVIEKFDKKKGKNDYVTRFHAYKPPNISIKEYITRIAKYATCSKECFIIMFIYIDRLIQRNPKLALTTLCAHRIIITSILIATKFIDDEVCSNAYYAKVGGLSVSELNQLELEFLFGINFDLDVNAEEVFAYTLEICKYTTVGKEVVRMHSEMQGQKQDNEQFLCSFLEKCKMSIQEGSQIMDKSVIEDGDEKMKPSLIKVEHNAHLYWDVLHDILF